MAKTNYVIKQMERIVTGGVAKLSNEEIVKSAVNLIDAKVNLTSNEFSAVYDLYVNFCKQNIRETFTAFTLGLRMTWMNEQFNRIAPVALFDGEISQNINKETISEIRKIYNLGASYPEQRLIFAPTNSKEQREAELAEFYHSHKSKDELFEEEFMSAVPKAAELKSIIEDTQEQIVRETNLVSDYCDKIRFVSPNLMKKQLQEGTITQDQYDEGIRLMEVSAGRISMYSGWLTTYNNSISAMKSQLEEMRNEFKKSKDKTQNE